MQWDFCEYCIHSHSPVWTQFMCTFCIHATILTPVWIHINPLTSKLKCLSGSRDTGVNIVNLTGISIIHGYIY